MTLETKIRTLGQIHPKKHGEWFALNVFNDHYLILDTWNGYIYHYPNGAEPSDTNNLYQCVYVFYDKNGLVNNYKRVTDLMVPFWNAHINLNIR